MAAKLDQTADFLCGPKWAIARDTSSPVNGASSAIKADRGPPMVWPAPFGRDLTKEEAYISKLDASTGASLKLTVLNAVGRVWTMVAGGEHWHVVDRIELTSFTGGASVVYSDAIAAAGYAHELANYGEYSGAPTEGQTYEYAKTIGKYANSSCLQPLTLCSGPHDPRGASVWRQGPHHRGWLVASFCTPSGR